ncbi:MAG TPA: M15 family metallopeptidase [Paenibacillus sp.]|nr:M15 family metallopeptidase [Paenibacillus sp.]
MKFKTLLIAAVTVAAVWFGAPYAADFLQPDTLAESPAPAPSDGTDEPAADETPEDEAPEGEPSTPVTGTPTEESPTDEPAEQPPAEAPEAEEPSMPISAEAKAAIVFVNKQNPLDASYKPDDLVVPDVKFSFDGDNPKKQLRREAAEALEKLFAKAEEDGIELRAVSGYRSYATQKAIFERNAKLKGEEEANRTSAYPGQSEHQTGLAMDVSAASVNYALEEAFGETAEGIWLAENAPSFGFIIRYPQNKEDITGYKYEPWHLRYLGVDIAEFVTEQGLTLEEFLEE